MNYFAEGSETTELQEEDVSTLLDTMLEQCGRLDRVLLLPPDITRLHSGAGEITVMLYERLRERAHIEIMPALGTHVPMSESEARRMFPGIPFEVFRPHNCRKDIAHLGEVPPEFVGDVSQGRMSSPIPCGVNRLLVEGRWDRIFSIGQLVPHEVIGIANYDKNIFVGVGGLESIHKTHYLGALCDIEKIMGRLNTPVRKVIAYMADHFARHLPITHVMTVRAKNEEGTLVTRGLFVGDDDDTFEKGAALSQKVNMSMLDAPIKKAIVYLDPGEFKSTWLGNKAVYRTRMAMADDGELIVLAPGIVRFGEDDEIDRLIRCYGYKGTPYILDQVEQHTDLAENLSAAAHLIHGSSEGRFTITYCTNGRGQGKGLSQEEVEGVGFHFAALDEMTARYNPATMKDGVNRMPDGEEVFYVSNPALGLWALKSQFEA